MNTFVKWLTISFLVLEIISAVTICFGLLFKSMNLVGGAQLLLLGLTTIALIFFSKSVTPFYKRYTSTSDSGNEYLPLILRRLLYVSMTLYSLALVFLSNQLTGTEEMMIIGFSSLIVTSFITAVLLFIRRDRIEVFMDSIVRILCLF